MYGLVIVGLLATVICVHSTVSNHYFVKKGSNNITCNWTVRIVCNNSSLIDIYNVTVLYGPCSGKCTACDDIVVGEPNATVSNTAIESQIQDLCNHQASCNTSLPDPGVLENKDMTHATVYYNCTNTSTTKKDSGTTVSVFSSPTTHAAGISENRSSIDTNIDASLSKTRKTTVIVSSSPATQAAGTSSKDLDTSTTKKDIGSTNSVFSSPTTHAAGISENITDTVIQPSSLNVVSAVVPTVLVLVAITVVTVVIIARRRPRRRNAGDKTAIRSDCDIDISRDGVSAEANRSVNVNDVQLSTTADDNGEYNTINLVTFTVTDGPTYNHVNSPIGNSQYDKTNVSPLIDSDYASCADIDGTVIVDDIYSHITNDMQTSSETQSNQGLPAKVSRSDYDHIELANLNDNNVAELATGDNTYSHIGTESVNGMTLVDVDQIGDVYSHIGHVIHDTDAGNLTNLQWGVAEALSSMSLLNILKTCENGTERKGDIENIECRDIQDSKTGKCGNANGHDLNNVENHILYQLKECDDSSESNHSYFTLEKM